MSTKLKLLITSSGSLLGQNILDSLETRRDQIEIIGINSVAENARNFRCNKVYLVPNTLSPEFEHQFLTIVKNEKPDMILPGRDEDCVFLCEIRTKYPQLFLNNIPFGSSNIPKMMFDKYQSYRFCSEHNLPFAETILFSTGDSETILNNFVAQHGFPLIVKPKSGFGSHGVFYVLNNDQLFELARDGEILIQEFLGDAEHINKFKDIFKKGIPLFFQVEEKEHYAAQTIISKDGEITDLFVSKHTMIHGRAEYSREIQNLEIENLARKSCTIFFENGWHGPVNFQVKMNSRGIWKIFEMNPRLTGSSSARAKLGYDEFGIISELFYPQFGFENLTKPTRDFGEVIKYLTDNLLLDSDVETLKKDKVWIKS
tara:strand:- start:1537 stop:2649 length:1113 start_codon:yes stop_codon:yes gene_type:complete